MGWTFTRDDQVASLDADIATCRALLAGQERAVFEHRVTDPDRQRARRRMLEDELETLERLRAALAAAVPSPADQEEA